MQKNLLFFLLCRKSNIGRQGLIGYCRFLLSLLEGYNKQEFNWEKYLKKCGAKAAPEHLFNEVGRIIVSKNFINSVCTL